jgi:hypothetical protein
METLDPFNFRADAGWSPTHDLVGYHVLATDGAVGKVIECNHATDESYLVLKTGALMFGHRVMVPAGTVSHIDHAEEKVYLDRTKAQVNAGPDFDPEAYTEPAYRSRLGEYYNDTYRAA